jgi:serine/threonine-protein kinase
MAEPVLGDRNLLHGVLAVQLNFVDAEQLTAAMGNPGGNVENPRPLLDILLEQQALDRESCELIEGLVKKHLQRHGGDSQRSLAALPATHRVREALSRAHGSASEATRSFFPLTDRAIELDLAAKRHAVSADGRYLIVRPHAKGGLGQVSLARDLQLDREVAYKELLEFHADDEDTRTRFELEAKITGALEHPGIVPVYSLGFNPEGRPFYVMRFIRGESLRSAISRLHAQSDRLRPLDPLELRLLLASFIDVCQAVHYAHSRGVLHRDIKPNNILLGDYGETLVVDWGLAKMLGAAASEDSNPEAPTPRRIPLGGSNVTHLGSIIGTPSYMSPEQANGDLDHLRPATDVFSLGATLYCLLTNQPPYFGHDPEQVLQQAKDCAWTPLRAVNPNIPKPLAAICNKALAAAPQDRYTSARALARDVERWLADEPVSAHRDSLWERTMRWARHHRSTVRIGALALLVVAIAGVTAAVLIDQARRDVAANRRLALDRLVQARASVDTWLTTTGEALDWDSASFEFQLLDPKVREARLALLEQATKEYERMAADETDDPDLELERARAYQRLGNVRRLAGSLDRAADEYRQAIETCRAVVAARPDDGESRRELVNSHNLLGATLFTSRQVEQATQEYEAALQAFDSLPPAEKTSTKSRDARAAAVYNLGVARLEARRFKEAESLLAEAFATYDELSNADEGGARFRLKAAQLRGTLAQVELGIGRVDAAVAQYQAANHELDGLVAAHPQNPDFLERRATMCVFSTLAWTMLGRVKEELAANEKARKDYERLLQIRPDSASYREHAAIAIKDLGRLQRELGQTESARESAQAAVNEFAELVKRYGAVPRYREAWAASEDELGVTLFQGGQYNTAATHLESAIAEFERLMRFAPQWAAYAERLAVTQSHYAQVLSELGKIDQAAGLYRDALDALVSLTAQDAEYAPYRIAAAFVRYHYGVFLRDLGRLADAHDQWIGAERLWQQLATERATDAACQSHLAWFHVVCVEPKLRQPQTAVQHARAALAASPENPRYHGLLAAALYRAGDWTGCLRALDDSRRFRGGTNDWDEFFRSMAQHQLGRTTDALASLAAGREWMAKNRRGDPIVRRIADEAQQLVNGAIVDGIIAPRPPEP